MYLKNITLRGFKSFAKKSHLDFEPGISVIVGPNGSGKSNIADAISWVLGEQSAKSLRGTSMEDIIFKSRNEELAIAEVSLVFDNKDKFLPLEFNDIKISRRVYQKGGSEYFINATPSRLSDILDITSDGGIGKGLYTIVNQGQIDETALSKPIERKKIIDEILGIAKHKQRRSRSKNKLIKVNSDIERIRDLMFEVKRTMDPLEIESKKAQKYFEVFNQLKEEEMSLFISDLNDLNESWEKENQGYDELESSVKKIKLKINEIENERNSYEEDFIIKQQSFENLKNKIENFNNYKNKFESNEFLIESKKNTFSTLNNILETQYLSIKNSVDPISSINMNQNNDLNSKIINEKINSLKNSLSQFYRKILSFIRDSSLMWELETEYNKIIDIIDSIDNYININYLKESKDASEVFNLKKNAENNNKITELRKRINVRLENILKLQKYCSQMIERSENFLNVMLKLNKSIDDLSKRIYEGFDEIIYQINNYNSRTNQFLKIISNLQLEKQNLENELYKISFKKEQIKEKVKNLTEEIFENYNLPIEYISKNYHASENKEKTRKIVRTLRNELKSFGSINPNATSEFQVLSKRYNFLETQKNDLIESKNKLEAIIKEINKRIEDLFNHKFEEINSNFRLYFKLLFPLGKGELILQDVETDDEKDFGIELKVDIGNSKIVPISLLSGGEKALVSVAFLFSVFATNYSPFYVFDEIDASLDDMNLNRFITLVKSFSRGRQIIIITHQKRTMEIADSIYGVTMQSTGISKIVSEKVQKVNETVN